MNNLIKVIQNNSHSLCCNEISSSKPQTDILYTYWSTKIKAKTWGWHGMDDISFTTKSQKGICVMLLIMHHSLGCACVCVWQLSTTSWEIMTDWWIKSCLFAKRIYSLLVTDLIVKYIWKCFVNESWGKPPAIARCSTMGKSTYH